MTCLEVVFEMNLLQVCGTRVGDGFMRDDCKVNKDIVATRPKAALFDETRRQTLFVKTMCLCANDIDVKEMM